jgi:hypothetical protein
MTYEDEVEVRRASKGTKVLGIGVAVLGVLGSFWGIVWFIRAYVEAPRVNAPAPMILAARESIPVPGPAPKVEPKPEAAETRPATVEPATPAQAATPPRPAPTAVASAPPAPEVSPAGAIADRWFAGNQFGIPGVAPAPAAPPAPPPAPAPVEAQPAAPAPVLAAAPAETPPDAEPEIEEVAESSVPAIAGPAPLPRRKPLVTAQVKRTDTTPLPRPRPDGPAPQSVWTGVTSGDERFANQQ